MAINEQDRQLYVAREAEELLRTLAHSTRDVPHPRDSVVRWYDEVYDEPQEG